MTATADEIVADTPLVHQFIRLHGRRPTPDELREYRRSGLLAQMRVRHRMRTRVARIITRL